MNKYFVRDHWLYDAIHTKYYRDGAADLVLSAPSYVYERFAEEELRKWVIRNAIPTDILHREEMNKKALDAGKIWYCGPSEFFTIADSGDNLLHPMLAKWTGPYAAERQFVCEVPNARLVGPEPIGLTQNNRVILETGDANETYLQFKLEKLVEENSNYQAAKKLRSLFSKSDQSSSDKKHLDAAFPLVRHQVDTYYHWIIEYLPKIRALETYRSETGINPTVLIQPDPPSWMIESLELAGCNTTDAVEWRDEEMSVDRLVVPMHRKRVMSIPQGGFPDDFNPSPDECRWLRDRMSSNIDNDQAASAEFASRIYISRKNAEYNRVLNEDEVVRTLSDAFGFKSYVLEEMTVADQILLFSQADVIVAPHGSGLVNMIHSQRDPIIFELFRDYDLRGFYFCLARQLGFDYHYFGCNTVNKNIIVNIGEIMSRIDSLVKC